MKNRTKYILIVLASLLLLVLTIYGLTEPVAAEKPLTELPGELLDSAVTVLSDTLVRPKL